MSREGSPAPDRHVACRVESAAGFGGGRTWRRRPAGEVEAG